MPAARGLGIPPHRVEVFELPGDQSFLLVRIEIRFAGALPHERFPTEDVGGGVEEDALGRQSVAACPSRLLLVGLEALGERGVEDEADVGAVDPHAEGDRRDDDVDRLAGERFLGAAPLGRVESGVVGLGEDPLGGEPGSKLLGLLPRDAVDDRRFATVAAERRQRLRDPVGAGDDAVAEVRPVECSEEHPRRAEVELGGDVGPDTRRGGGREGVNARCGEAVAEEGQLPVFGAEVVAPLADAVGLVDREPLHADAGEEVEEPAVDEPLRNSPAASRSRTFVRSSWDICEWSAAAG